MQDVLERIYATIVSRKESAPTQAGKKPSYVASLFARGKNRITQKVGEEAVELVLAAAQNNRKEIISESTDLLFHLMVLLAAHEIKPEEITAELLRREGISGIREKAARR